MTFEELKKRVDVYINRREFTRSAWGRGVNVYVDELMETLEDADKWHNVEDWNNYNTIAKYIYNGADNWKQYSWGGCSLIYDCDIAKRLCTPKALEKCKGGRYAPRRGMAWLDIQALALSQACLRIMKSLDD